MHDELWVPVAASKRPAPTGKASGNVTPNSELIASGLVTVNINVEVAPAVIVAGVNVLLTLGGFAAAKIIVEKKVAQANWDICRLSKCKAVL